MIYCAYMKGIKIASLSLPAGRQALAGDGDRIRDLLSIDCESGLYIYFVS
jgi:hypothetical protein